MKTPATLAALLAIGSLLTLPLCAQYDMPAPPPDTSAPQDDPYAPQGQQAPPPPDQQYAPDPSQGPPPGQSYSPDQGPGPTDPNAPNQAAPDASFQTFYDNLAQQGTWIQSPDYGYVWQPNVNDPNWAPYTDGHWVYSDAGWTWVTDEPWGWATYHYGRWVNLNGSGWCWVPGYTWAPAWVSWRYGDGYCGWAPLPPDSFVGIDYGGPGISVSVGFHIGGDCDSYYGIGAGWYHFVPVNYLGYRNYRGHYADPHNNFAIINRTTNVTNLNVNGNRGNGGPRNFNHVTMGGPSFAQVNAASQTPVQRVTLTSAAQPGQARLAHNSLAVFAPHVSNVAPGQPPRLGGSLGRATVNRGVDITQPLAVNRSLAGITPTQTQIQQAQLAQRNAPARVVTPTTVVNTPLQAPLTSLKPVTTASPPQSNFANSPHNAGTVQTPVSNAAHVQPPGQTTTAPVLHNSINPNNGSVPVNTPHTVGSQVNPYMQPPHPTQAIINTPRAPSPQVNPVVQQSRPQPTPVQQPQAQPQPTPAQLIQQNQISNRQNNAYPSNNQPGGNRNYSNGNANNNGNNRNQH